MSFLKIRNLTYTYPGGIRAVDGLSLDAEPGEFIAVVGPNAAGKSTFALLLKGLLKAEKGTVNIGGRIRQAGGTDSKVGILFSNPENQIITSIVEEDIAFNLEVAGRPPEEIVFRVQDVLERLGIQHLRERMPHLLSGGEQQMVALAGVLIQEPDILILDEPTTFLDPDGRESVLTALRGLARQGKTVFLITHDMSEASLADRVLLMGDGRLVQDSSPKELFSRDDISTDYGIVAPFMVRIGLAFEASGHTIEGPLNVKLVSSAIRNMFGGDWIKSGFPDATAFSFGQQETPAISFEGVHFSYGVSREAGRELLSGLDLSVPHGSVAMICGSNGSGKSTLLQMANGLIWPDRGRVLYEHRPVSMLRREKGGIHSRIALLFQNPERQLFSETVFEDIAFGPRNLGLSNAEVTRRVEEAAHWAGISECLLGRPIHSLSNGQMRRAAVAGVLAMGTAVLVLDEPTDGLDPGGAREFYKRVSEYCREKGTTVLMAAHSVPEEIHYISHFSHLDKGQIKSKGPTGKVLSGPARTLPERYLPDHLVLQDHLFAQGAAGDCLELDSHKVEEMVMGIIKDS